MAENNAPSVSTELKPYVEADRVEFLRVGITGVAAGLAIPLLGQLIGGGLISSLFCRGDTSTAVCVSADATGYHTAAVLIGAVVLVLFASWGVFRPLPLVAAVTVALWGLRSIAEPLGAVQFYIISALLTALAYLTFFWLLRLRNFPASALLTAAAVALVVWVSVA